MKKILLIGVLMVVGCNYYGPENPPPAPTFPVYHFQMLSRDANVAVAGIQCPSNTLPISSGGDCSNCAGAATVMFGSRVAGNGAVVGCASGCASIELICESSNASGTITAGLDTEFQAKLAEFEARRESK